MFLLWAACLFHGLSVADASAFTGGEKTNVTNASSFSINSAAFEQLAQHLSAKNETRWWRTTDVSKSTVSEVLNLWNITHDELQARSQLRGNASALHIHAYLQQQKLLENSTCEQVSYQMLDHGRLLYANHSVALEYGNVLGNMTGKGGACAAELAKNALEVVKRQQAVTHGYYSAEAFLTAIGFGGLYFSVWKVCEVDVVDSQGNWKVGRLGQRECTLIAAFSTLAAGIGIAQGIAKHTTSQAVRAGMVVNAHQVDIGTFNDIGRDQINYYHAKRGLRLDAEDEETELLHGYYNRNLTYNELMSANFTHRTAIHYQDPVSGFNGPLEVWHQDHPTRPDELTTHVAFHPHLSAKDLKKAHEKRVACSNSDWGINIGSFAETHWCNEGLGSGAPTSIFYGFETYAPSKYGAWSSDVGVGNVGYNAFVQFVGDVEKHIYQTGAWDECICFKEQGTWFSTGALQFSWNNAYNGYSQCWAARCGLGHDEL